MTYTFHKVSWQKCQSKDSSVVDEYGDIKRNVAIDVLARKEPHQEVVKTSDGKEVLSKSRYYIDPYLEPHALDIKKMDMLDGEIIESVYVMCDLYNKPKMIRFITI